MPSVSTGLNSSLAAAVVVCNTIKKKLKKYTQLSIEGFLCRAKSQQQAAQDA